MEYLLSLCVKYKWGLQQKKFHKIFLEHFNKTWMSQKFTPTQLDVKAGMLSEQMQK